MPTPPLPAAPYEDRAMQCRIARKIPIGEAPKGAYRVRVQVTDSPRTRFGVCGDSEFE